MTNQPTLFDTPAPTTTTIPTARPTPNTWLRDHLIATGHLTETGLTRHAQLRTCPRPHCTDLILTGLDNDQCALEARTDPTPLTPLGEALATIDGRRTYDLTRDRNGFVLNPRDHHQITWAPAATRPRHDVVRQHHCHTPPPTGPLTAPTSFTEATPRPPAGTPAPF